MEEGETAVGLFKHRYDALGEFQDVPVPMPPIASLMRGEDHQGWYSEGRTRFGKERTHAGLSLF